MLVLAGTAAIAWSIPISFAILFLVVVLTISYRQIIYEYPEGGGAYIVSRNNLGELPALIAAAALMIDYVLTVAVSVAAGIAALTSAIPSLFAHRETLGLVASVFIIVMNLRGVRESGKFFAVPTYFAIGALGGFRAVGVRGYPPGRRSAPPGQHYFRGGRMPRSSQSPPSAVDRTSSLSVGCAPRPGSHSRQTP